MPRNNDETKEIDRIVGERIKDLRVVSGMSRDQLGEIIDVTHQQLQKYEYGTNRVSVGRLVIIARALGKEVSYFFNESTPPLPNQHQRMAIGVSRNFLKIKNPKCQNAINDMVRTLSEESACTP